MFAVPGPGLLMLHKLNGDSFFSSFPLSTVPRPQCFATEGALQTSQKLEVCAFCGCVVCVTLGVQPEPLGANPEGHLVPMAASQLLRLCGAQGVPGNCPLTGLGSPSPRRAGPPHLRALLGGTQVPGSSFLCGALRSQPLPSPLRCGLRADLSRQCDSLLLQGTWVLAPTPSSSPSKQLFPMRPVHLVPVEFAAFARHWFRVTDGRLCV